MIPNCFGSRPPFVGAGGQCLYNLDEMRRLCRTIDAAGGQAYGVTLHTCSRPLANGPSLPSTEQTLENLRWLGHTHAIDESS